MADLIMLTPVPHSATDMTISNGWGGTKPLPAVRVDGGIATAWIPSKAAIKALRGHAAITLVVTTQPDGSPCISMAVTLVTLTDRGRQ